MPLRDFFFVVYIDRQSVLVFSLNIHLFCRNLKGNNLTGFVPRSLRKRTMAGGLALRYIFLSTTILTFFKIQSVSLSVFLKLFDFLSVSSVDEHNICHSRSCREGNRIVVPVVVSTLVIVLIIALVIICIMRRERKIGKDSWSFLLLINGQ